MNFMTASNDRADMKLSLRALPVRGAEQFIAISVAY
jgi:hypothetical protein